MEPITKGVFKHGGVRLNPEYFREGSRLRQSTYHFVMVWGGLGDLLGYMAAILWMAKTTPQMNGRIHCHPFFVEVAENILKPYRDKWRVIPNAGVDPFLPIKSNPKFKGHMVFSSGPLYFSGGNSFVSLATGVHMIDQGFIQFLQQNPPPSEGNYFPELDLSHFLEPELPAPYAIMTPGFDFRGLRTMADETFNAIKDHLILKGVTPVFLGKAPDAPTNGIESGVSVYDNTIYSRGCDFSGGINLIGRTTILGAAKIIQGAKLIVGLDNGLLHLAACTGPIPIVAGYNIVAPELRRARRRTGVSFEITPDPKKLACTFCQSRMRFISYDETDMCGGKCAYDDLACLKELADPAQWIEKIDQALDWKQESLAKSRGETID